MKKAKLTMKRILAVLITACIACVLLTACLEIQSSYSYTFGIENGDMIKVELEDGSGFKLVRDGSNFYVLQIENPSTGGLDTEMLRGGFILTDGNRWQSVYVNIDAISDAWIIDEEEVDGDQYIYVDYSETMYLCEIKLKDCDTGVEVSSGDLEMLRHIMGLLSFTVIK